MHQMIRCVPVGTHVSNPGLMWGEIHPDPAPITTAIKPSTAPALCTQYGSLAHRSLALLSAVQLLAFIIRPTVGLCTLNHHHHQAQRSYQPPALSLLWLSEPPTSEELHLFRI